MCVENLRASTYARVMRFPTDHRGHGDALRRPSKKARGNRFVNSTFDALPLKYRVNFIFDTLDRWADLFFVSFRSRFFVPSAIIAGTRRRRFGENVAFGFCRRSYDRRTAVLQWFFYFFERNAL